jgi:hypothetical protein
MARARIRPGVRQPFGRSDLGSNEPPVLFQPLESANKIGQDISIRIDEPVQLISVRGRVNAGAAAVLNPIDEFIERHFCPQFQGFLSFVEGNHSVPRIAHESKFEIAIKLLLPDSLASLWRQHWIENFSDPVFPATTNRPIALHQRLDLPEVEMRPDRFAQNSSNTGRPSFWHLNKNAFVLMRDHARLFVRPAFLWFAHRENTSNSG